MTDKERLSQLHGKYAIAHRLGKRKTAERIAREMCHLMLKVLKKENREDRRRAA